MAPRKTSTAASAPAPRETVSRLWSEGRALIDQGKWSEAAEKFYHACRLEPANQHFHRAYGLAVVRLDRFDEAIAAFRRAVEIDASFARAHADLGVTLLKIGQVYAAIEKLTVALTLEPDLRQARECLIRAYADAGSPEPALSIPRGRSGRRENGDALGAIAFALLRQGRVEEGFSAVEKALAITPDHPQALPLRSGLVHYLPGADAAMILAIHREGASRLLDGLATANLRFDNLRVQDRRLRIGFVSGDFHRHAVGYLTLRAVEALGKLGQRIYCYASAPLFWNDDFTDRYRKVSHRWREISGLNDDAATKLIREDGIDILFDLSGLTLNHRLGSLAQRAAPIQITWAGYTGTTGLRTMDAIICDEREIPIGEDACYTERPIRLPDCYVSYEPPDPSPAVTPAPHLARGYVTFGCFQRPAKLSKQLIAAWGRILAELPEARLELRYTGFETPSVQERFSRALADAAIRPERVLMDKGGKHYGMLEAYAGIDITLDSYPYSGGVTTLEACWMGVPVIGWAAPSFAGRHSLSHLTALGLADLVASDAESCRQSGRTGAG